MRSSTGELPSLWLRVSGHCSHRWCVTMGPLPTGLRDPAGVRLGHGHLWC